jgi:hypothetical protein
MIPKTIEQIGKEIEQLHHDTYNKKIEDMRWRFISEGPYIDIRLSLATLQLTLSLSIFDFHIRQSERRVINEINQCPL